MSKRDSEELAHLNSQTREIVGGSLQEKIRWVRQDHFVVYPKAKRILEDLDWIITQEQTPLSDLESLTIVGESGIGKTSIVSYFKRLHMTRINTGDYEAHTIAHCILPDADLGLKGLYSSILKAEPFNYPVSQSKLQRKTTIQLEEECIRQLQNTQVKILFVDEVQHALGRKVQTTLNSLKRVLLVSGVPMVLVGTTKRTEDVLNTDDQLNDRCPIKPYSRLTPWKYDKQFRSFLKSYEMFIPFPEPSDIFSSSISKIIFNGFKMKKEQLIFDEFPDC